MGKLVEYLISYFHTGNFARKPDISQAELQNKKQFLWPLPEYIPNLVSLNHENYLHIKTKENNFDFL